MNNRELDVLSILWGANRPLTSSEIVNAGKGLSQSTVQAVLRKLLTEKIVKVSGITHSGNVLSRQYEPDTRAKEMVMKYFIDRYRGFEKIISKEEVIEAIKNC